MAFTDARLYDRMLATMLATWRRVAGGSTGASIERIPGATVGLFPSGPERGVYNNAVLERGLDESQAAEAVASLRPPGTLGWTQPA